MKINELMLGDWVLDTEFERNEPDKIGIVEDDGRVWLKNRNCYQSVTYCKPIPITPEILEKNGFKKKEEGETYSEYISVWEEISIISFVFYKETICGVDTLLECELGFPGGLDRIHHCHIKYVHQLQHALRMCGIEKEITP